MAALKLPALRAQIARAQADLAALPEIGRTRAEREASLRQFARDAAEEGAKHLRYAVGSDNPASALSFAPSHGGVVNSTSRIAALLGADRLADALITYLPDDDADAPSAEDRAARVAALNAELLDLGRREEDLIEAAEARGEAVQRRPDADPAVVLRVRAAP